MQTGIAFDGLNLVLTAFFPNPSTISVDIGDFSLMVDSAGSTIATVTSRDVRLGAGGNPVVFTGICFILPISNRSLLSCDYFAELVCHFFVFVCEGPIDPSSPGLTSLLSNAISGNLFSNFLGVTVAGATTSAAFDRVATGEQEIVFFFSYVVLVILRQSIQEKNEHLFRIFLCVVSLF
jgi:hypothetical protein